MRFAREARQAESSKSRIAARTRLPDAKQCRSTHARRTHEKRGGSKKKKPVPTSWGIIRTAYDWFRSLWLSLLASHTLSCTARHRQAHTPTPAANRVSTRRATRPTPIAKTQAHLDEANVVRALAEALSAHIEVVLADQTVAVSCSQRTRAASSHQRTAAALRSGPNAAGTHRTRGSGGLRGSGPWGARSAEPCSPSARKRRAGAVRRDPCVAAAGRERPVPCGEER